MKLKISFFLLLSIFILSFSSCLGKDDPDDSVTASNPDFVSLTFGKNDSIPNLDKAKFTLEWDSELQDSVIVNLDSLPFQTRIDSVFPTFQFRSVSVRYLYQTTPEGIDTIQLTGTDTINFTFPSRVHNYSAKGDSSRIYPIKVNVHRVEPELYVWKKIKDNIVSTTAGKQKALFFKNQYFYYFSSDIRAYLYTSVNGEEWSEASSSLNAFPPTASLWHMQKHADSLFVSTNDNKLFASPDGLSWQEITYTANSYNIHSLLFSLQGNLWAIVKNGANDYQVASSKHGNVWNIEYKIPEGFPVNDYSSLAFTSFVGNSRGIVLGGTDIKSRLVQMNWTTDNGKKWINLGGENTTLGAFAGGSLIQYDKKLLLFGGMEDNNKTRTKFLRESTDQGLSWKIPDSTYNVLPESYQPRSYQSAFVVDKKIYLIGGKETDNYSDIWTGKLNRLSFAKQ